MGRTKKGLYAPPRRGLIATIKKHWFIYLMVLPGLAFVAVFSYGPMYGLQLAFKDYNLGLGISGSPWAGFKYFSEFLADSYFWKVLRNTLLINLYNIAFGFTFTIFLALMLNELRLRKTKKVIQTAVYLPYFLSWVVFAGLINILLDPQNGMLTKLILSMGGPDIVFMADNRFFRAIVVISATIKDAGYDSILYLAALAGVNPELYESAKVDGANRRHMMRYITLPHIYPTIAILLLLRLSRLLVSNFEQIFNMLTPMVRETGDVISTYIYRMGRVEGQFSLTTAVGLFTNLIGLLILIIANWFISRKNIVGVL